MYLYFNNNGVMTTAIPHGEIPRQGSYLNIYVCLGEDFFTEEEKTYYNVNVELVLPNNTLGTTKVVSSDEPSLEIFRKVNDSEVTYGLVDGRRYWTYHFNFTPEESTVYFGKLLINVSVVTASDIGDTEYEIKDIDYLGTTEVYVEKTFGYAKRTVDEASLHYDNIIKQLNIIASRLNYLYGVEPDKEMSDTSENAVANRVIKEYVDNKDYIIKKFEEDGIEKFLKLQLDTDNLNAMLKVFEKGNENNASTDFLVSQKYIDKLFGDINNVLNKILGESDTNSIEMAQPFSTLQMKTKIGNQLPLAYEDVEEDKYKNKTLLTFYRGDDKESANYSISVYTESGNLCFAGEYDVKKQIYVEKDSIVTIIFDIVTLEKRDEKLLYGYRIDKDVVSEKTKNTSESEHFRAEGKEMYIQLTYRNILKEGNK